MPFDNERRETPATQKGTKERTGGLLRRILRSMRHHTAHRVF